MTDLLEAVTAGKWVKVTSVVPRSIFVRLHGGTPLEDGADTTHVFVEKHGVDPLSLGGLKYTTLEELLDSLKEAEGFVITVEDPPGTTPDPPQEAP